MKLALTEAHALVCDTLMRCKVDPAIAKSVATALVTAEAAGQGGHGLRRVPAYAGQARAGKVDGFAKPVVDRPFPGVLRIDAQYGFAYPALDMMVDMLPDMARRQGIAIAAIHKSHHAGVMGLTVEKLADQGLAAMMFANAPAAMAPWGGRRPMFGTNPIAFATPIRDGDPIVIDLAAGLTGAQFGHQSSSLFDDKGGPPALGQMVIAIDPVAVGGPAIMDHLRYIADEIALEEAVRLPGRRGQNARRDAEIHGLDIEDDVIAAIDDIK